MKTPLMECGHAANAILADNSPACVICYGIRPGADKPDRRPLNLDSRVAVCGYYCGTRAASSTSLAFFEARPDEPTDNFYCGCRGWD